MNLMTFLFKMLSMISHMISIASSWNRNSGYSQVGESFRILDLPHVVRGRIIIENSRNFEYSRRNEKS